MRRSDRRPSAIFWLHHNPLIAELLWFLLDKLSRAILNTIKGAVVTQNSVYIADTLKFPI